ncbi:hypothetical protein [Desulfonema ishimotonii]|uniref:hypothetical protein n=1 Tax=Desulfonema ishimotonii TaxID=45657 RepID=UPI000F569CFB|nr:hypothetical protein [Desulfonema ishimotonii]
MAISEHQAMPVTSFLSGKNYWSVNIRLTGNECLIVSEPDNRQPVIQILTEQQGGHTLFRVHRIPLSIIRVDAPFMYNTQDIRFSYYFFGKI